MQPNVPHLQPHARPVSLRKTSWLQGLLCLALHCMQPLKIENIQSQLLLSPHPLLLPDNANAALTLEAPGGR